MKRSSLKIAALLSVFGCAAVQGREVRTPLPFMSGPMRYPVEYHWENEKDDWCFDFEAFGGAYSRSADVAYSSCHGRTEVPWANLIFGKSDFRMEEAFFGADVGTTSINNPWISVSNLKARVEYEEKGAVFGAQIGTTVEYCDTDYRLGLRARLPFRDISVNDNCAAGTASDFVGEQLDDVYQERIGAHGSGATDQEPTVFAARLDFLSALKWVQEPQSEIKNLVDYRNTAKDPDQITIADESVGAAVTDNFPVIAVIGRTDGTVPLSQNWGAQNSAITATVSADGSGVGNDVRGRFVDTTNYATTLQGDTVAQSKLFVVPTLQNTGDINKLTGGAVKIQSAIRTSILGIEDSIEDFITTAGLDFCDGRTKGLGDLDLELFAGRNFGCDDQFWGDLMLGLRVPTSDDECDLADCKKVFRQPLGNGDHVEIRGGFAGGWDAYDWFKVMGDLSFSKVLSEKEKVAAPFKGATVKNIGPCVDADIDWWYLNGHVDLSFFASDCCGFDFGYEIYHKDCDEIKLCSSTAKEFQIGAAEPTAKALDASVLSKDTERTSHKLRVGFFTLVGDCEIFAGWSHVLAGKNVPRETDWYCSMNVSF